MAPVNMTHCTLLLSKMKYNTSELVHPVNSSNSSIAEPEAEKSQIHALLYIVITLLFYSLGIVVGIISYLKREKREMEEDRMYDSYVASRQDPVWSPKYEKVQQVISRLQVLEKEKLARIANQKEAERLLQSDHLQHQSDNENTEIDKTKSKRSSRLMSHFSVKIRDFSENQHTFDPCSQLPITKSTSQQSVNKLGSKNSVSNVGSLYSMNKSSSQYSVDNVNESKRKSSHGNSPQTHIEHLI